MGAPLAPGILLTSMEQSVEKKWSQYGLQTTYILTTQSARLDPSFVGLPMPTACDKRERVRCQVSSRTRYASEDAELIMPELLESEVYLLSYESDTYLFSWLLPESFDALESEEGG